MKQVLTAALVLFLAATSPRPGFGEPTGGLGVAIRSLQVVAGVEPAGPEAGMPFDISGDGRVGTP